MTGVVMAAAAALLDRQLRQFRRCVGALTNEQLELIAKAAAQRLMARRLIER